MKIAEIFHYLGVIFLAIGSLLIIFAFFGMVKIDQPFAFVVIILLVGGAVFYQAGNSDLK